MARGNVVLFACAIGSLAAGCGREVVYAPRLPARPASAATTAALRATDPKQAPRFTLPGLRRELVTTVFGRTRRGPAPIPPPAVFESVRYPAPLGSNAAYVSPARPGARRPAIVWIPGGFDWDINEGLWEPAPRENDQTASAFRNAGIVLMLPSLRGSNDNPGQNECFLGEVDDILAAADFVASRPDVDPNRVYLGGHSTGGTLALLVAESTDRFRAVFAFGPVADPSHYGGGCLPRSAPRREINARKPARYMGEIVTPTFVIEGSGRGNVGDFPDLQDQVGSAPVRFLEVRGADHFTVLAPVTEIVAGAIVTDAPGRPTFELSSERVEGAVDPSAMAR